MAPAASAAVPLFGLRRRFDRWLFRLRPAEPYPVLLVQRRIFVLPTAAGLGFAATLFAMLLASINYNLSLGFALTFLLAGLGIASIFHAFRNLLHLDIRSGASDRAHVGESVRFEILISDHSGRPRPALHVRAADATAWAAVPAHGSGCVELVQRGVRRGWQPIGRVVIETTYPLGLVRAWSVLTPDQRVLVYPSLEGTPPQPPHEHGIHDSGGSGHGDDDFSGLREHHLGDSPRRIAWKAVARSDTLVSKDFSGGHGADLRLDWHALPAGMDVETRLSRLTRWVVDAAHAGQRYALVLPDRQFGPARSAAHLELCLEALALHGLEGDDGAQR